MISLTYPLDNENLFVISQLFALGPVGPDTTLKGELTEFNSSLRSLDGTRGIYGENHVTHTQVTGSLIYYPWIYGVAKKASAEYPNQITLTVKDNYRPGYTTKVTAALGLFINKAVAADITTSQRKHYACEIDPITGVHRYYEVWCFINNPTVITNLYCYELLDRGKPSFTTYSTIKWDRMAVDTGSGGIISGIDWSKEQSWDTIKSAWTSRAWRATHYAYNGIGFYYEAIKTSEAIRNPRTQREQIDTLVASLFPEKFPVEEMNYGDLAMKASEKVNANKVNMIAFLRDLRHPTEMIPKLGNLTKLKVLADNYLTVKYGVLPTIDDIKSIFEAFRRHGPYIDKNGFGTYSAGYVNTSKVDDLEFKLEQHVKLAIGDEDSDFEALIQRLESMGTLPTLENLWDLVPYSFVIDWLVDVGGFLARIDTRLRLTRLGIQYATMSRKESIVGYNSFPTTQFPFVGTIDLVNYHRWVSDQCPLPPLPLTSPIADFNHWLESGALLVQRAKH